VPVKHSPPAYANQEKDGSNLEQNRVMHCMNRWLKREYDCAVEMISELLVFLNPEKTV
jgi:hypothetical protein